MLNIRKNLSRLIQQITRASRSLTSVIFSLMLILVLIPLLTVGGISYFRSRALLKEQTISQLQILAESNASELEDLAIYSQQVLSGISDQKAVQDSINSLVKEPNNQERQILASYQLISQLTSYRTTRNYFASEVFDHLTIVQEDGRVLATTNIDWRNLNFNSISQVNSLIGNNRTIALYNPKPLFTNKLVIFTSYQIPSRAGTPPLTVIGSSLSNEPLNILNNSSAFSYYAHAYFLTVDGQLITNSPGKNEIINPPPDPEHILQINQFVTDGRKSGTITLSDNRKNLSYVKWLPTNQISLILEVPQSYIFSIIKIFDFYNLFALFIALMVTGIVIYATVTSLINPLTNLTNQAKVFSEGDLSQRSAVKRQDEIGQLAESFNQMGSQLQEMYQSLESKVADQTARLHSATLIAQHASQTSQTENIAAVAVRELVEVFGFHFASLFLVDPSSGMAILEATSHTDNTRLPNRGLRFPITNDGLVGWVIRQGQSKVIIDFKKDSLCQKEILLPESMAEVGVPIMFGGHALGMLEVQSMNAHAFDAETVYVLETLANQIATGFQTLRMIENTQASLEVTSLLYEACQQVSHDQNEADITRSLISTLDRTGYVSAVIDVKEGYLSIVVIKDPQSTSSAGTGQGIALPLQRIVTRLTEQPLILLDDISQPSEFENILSFFSRRGCKSAALFAIKVEDRVSKIVILGSREAEPISQPSMQPFAKLFDSIGYMLGRIELVASLQSRVAELQTFESVSEAISVETDIENLYQIIHQQIVSHFGDGLGFLICTFDKENNTIHVPYLYEDGSRLTIDPFPLGEGLSSIVINTRKPLMLVSNTEQLARELGAKIQGRPAKSWLGVPLIAASQMIGVMVIQDSENEDRFIQKDLEMMTRLAPQIAITIRNAQLLRQMQAALQAYDQERQLLMTWLTNTPDLIFFKDQEGRYTRSSNSYLKYLDLSSFEELQGKTDYDLFPEEIATQNQNSDNEIMATGKALFGLVERRFNKEGLEYFYLITKIPFTDSDGNSRGILGIARDITAFQHAQDLSQRRAQQLEIAAEIARESSGTLNIDDVLLNSVNLVRERFSFYHASIFLVDSLNQFVVLREATGEAGKVMKEARHQLAIGSKSLVGQATATGQIMVVNDVSLDPNYYPNPLLPETKAELTIPLSMGEHILGALDVQSTTVDAFQQEDVNVLQILADQLAVAVINANLYSASQQNIEKHRLLHNITSTVASKENLDDVLRGTVETLSSARFGDRVCILLANDQNILELRASTGYQSINPDQFHIPIGEGMIGGAAQQQHEVRINNTHDTPGYIALDERSQSQIIVPISYSSRLLGMLIIESDQVAAFNDSDLEIIATLGSSLGATMLSVNLLTHIRQQVERQRLLFDITNKIRRAVDIPTILETSATEIGKALRAHRAQINITVSPEGRENKNAGTTGDGRKNTS